MTINNCFITEISEEDFRKLNLKGYRVKKNFVEGSHPGAKNKEGSWVYFHEEVNLNDELDENINYWLEAGFETNLEDLKQPVTVAIHTENGPNDKDFYFDKFMNQFSGPKTYEIAMGLRHIYSTRDYYESKEDYWRVLKRETKAIYRIHLDPKHLNAFKLKHKTKKVYIFKDNSNVEEHYIEENSNLNEETQEWHVDSICEVKKSRYSSSYYSISSEEKERLISIDSKL